MSSYGGYSTIHPAVRISIPHHSFGTTRRYISASAAELSSKTTPQMKHKRNQCIPYRTGSKTSRKHPLDIAFAIQSRMRQAGLKLVTSKRPLSRSRDSHTSNPIRPVDKDNSPKR